jgi:hypothetical protein
MTSQKASPPPIEQKLHEAAGRLRDADHLEQGAQDALANLADELATALGQGAVASAEEERLAEHVLQLIEALHPHRREGLLTAARSHLEDAMFAAEVRAPLAAGVARRLLEVLSNLGI